MLIDLFFVIVAAIVVGIVVANSILPRLRAF
jgi:hypothetical protein